MNNIYSIWKTGYTVSTALGVELVAETEKAIKFKVLNSSKEYTFYLPKRVLSFDKDNEGIINLAHWFTIDGFLAFLFDHYANHYRR